MSVEELLQEVPAFVLVVFRVAGLMAYAPLLGSAKIPKRVKVLLAVVMAMGLTPAVAKPVRLPDSAWQAAVGIGGELMFGVAMGLVLSLVFIAAQWAGEMMGQQMGLNLSETFDPQFGQQGSLVGDLYFMATLVVFLTLRGHHALLNGVRASFDSLPLLSVGMDRPLLETLMGLVDAATGLAARLAAPMLVTMLVVDLALGFVSKTVPQINVMSAGLSLRSAIGMAVLIAGLTLTSDVLRGAVADSMDAVQVAWTARSAK